MIEPAGAGIGARFPLVEEVTVGRGMGCEMVVQDMSVSRTHARLAPLPDGRLRVTDLGSVNGTFVNDERVTAGAVGDGDRLRLGACVFRFVAARG
jgi:pSer/pThr/pTyr-binding forkhead associated (FHA) protein